MFEWCEVGCGSKNNDQKYVRLEEIGPRVQILLASLDNIIGGRGGVILSLNKKRGCFYFDNH